MYVHGSHLQCQVMLCCRYTLLLKGLELNTTRHMRCKYLMVTHGILSQQYTLQERGLDPGTRFKGIISYAGMSKHALLHVFHTVT